MGLASPPTSDPLGSPGRRTNLQRPPAVNDEWWVEPIRWAALAVFIAADLALWVVVSVAFAGSGAAVVTGVILTIALVVPLIAVCYVKGEKPSWHWGRRAW